VVSKDFKKKNFDMNIRVSEQSIQKLRAGKTFEANVARAKKTGLNVEDREAMNRFYGKTRVSSALGTATSSKANNAMTGIKASSVPPAKNPTTAGPGFNGVSSTNYKTPGAVGRTAAPKRSTMNQVASGTGNFIKNELLGVDDFSKLRGQMKKHQWKNMAKSLAEGSFELGTTIAAVAAAAPTGGGSLAARSAMVAAKQGGKSVAKTGAKMASKEAAKTGAKTVVTKAGKAYAEGSVRGAVRGTGKGVVKVAKAPVRGYKGARGAYTSAKATVEAERYAKSAVGLGETRAKAAANAAKNATTTATKAAKEAKAKKAAADKLIAAGKGGRPVKGTAAAKKAAAQSAAQRNAANAAARAANKSAGNIGKMAASRSAKAAAEKAAKEARKKALRGATKKNLKIRGVGAANTYVQRNR
jgi:hypothetical protein